MADGFVIGWVALVVVMGAASQWDSWFTKRTRRQPRVKGQ